MKIKTWRTANTTPNTAWDYQAAFEGMGSEDDLHGLGSTPELAKEDLLAQYSYLDDDLKVRMFKKPTIEDDVTDLALRCEYQLEFGKGGIPPSFDAWKIERQNKLAAQASEDDVLEAICK